MSVRTDGGAVYVCADTLTCQNRHHEIRRLKEAIAAKTAECERMWEDAARYQLLRSRAFLDGDESGPYEPLTFVLMIPASTQNESFDAAIDAARKETP